MSPVCYFSADAYTCYVEKHQVDMVWLEAA